MMDFAQTREAGRKMQDTTVLVGSAAVRNAEARGSNLDSVLLTRSFGTLRADPKAPDRVFLTCSWRSGGFQPEDHSNKEVTPWGCVVESLESPPRLRYSRAPKQAFENLRILWANMISQKPTVMYRGKGEPVATCPM